MKKPLAQRFSEHIDDYDAFKEEMREEMATFRRLMLGDKATGERGIKEMTTEMYEVVIAMRGWKSFGGIILLLGGVIVALKALGINIGLGK